MSTPPTSTATSFYNEIVKIEMRTKDTMFYIKNLVSFLYAPHFKPIDVPSAWNCSDIWKANSLVGVKIKAKSFCREVSKACNIGRAKAPVFPEPVSAKPITSFPKI